MIAGLSCRNVEDAEVHIEGDFDPMIVKMRQLDTGHGNFDQYFAVLV